MKFLYKGKFNQIMYLVHFNRLTKMEYTCFRCAYIIFILFLTICIMCTSAGCGIAQKMFMCADGKKRIPLSTQCNGKADCGDNSDEQNCTFQRGCKLNQKDEFFCEDRRNCIPILARCDGEPDCADQSDEKNCTMCPFGKESCPDRSACITPSQKCDTVKDCSDGSDEQLQKCSFDILLLLSKERPSTGVTYSVGSEAFQVKHNASIDGQPVGKFFTNNTLNKNFAVTATLRLLSTEASLFSIVNPANINQFGVEVAQTTRDLTNYTEVSIYYTSDARSKNSSTILAQLYIPDITYAWTDLGIKINDSTVEIYQDCILINSTSVVQREQIVFDQDSFVYLASNGSNNSVSFVGELMELKVHKYPENAIHPHCKEYQVDDGSGLGYVAKVSDVHIDDNDAFTKEDNTDGKQIKQTEAKSTFLGAQENVGQDVDSNDNEHTLPNTDVNTLVTQLVNTKDQHISPAQAKSSTLDLKFVLPATYRQRVENKENYHMVSDINANGSFKSEVNTREPQETPKANVPVNDDYNTLNSEVSTREPQVTPKANVTVNDDYNTLKSEVNTREPLVTPKANVTVNDDYNTLKSEVNTREQQVTTKANVPVNDDYNILKSEVSTREPQVTPKANVSVNDDYNTLKSEVNSREPQVTTKANVPVNDDYNTLKSEVNTREQQVTPKAYVPVNDGYNTLKTEVHNQDQVITNHSKTKEVGISSSMQGSNENNKYSKQNSISTQALTTIVSSLLPVQYVTTSNDGDYTTLYRETKRKQKYGDQHTLTTAETTYHNGPGSMEEDRELSITAVIIVSTTAVTVSVSLSVCVTFWLTTKFVNLKRLRERERKSSITCCDNSNIKQRRLSINKGAQRSTDRNNERANEEWRILEFENHIRDLTESGVEHHLEQLDVDEENNDKEESEAIIGGGDSFELINEHMVTTEASAADENPVIMTTFF